MVGIFWLIVIIALALVFARFIIWLIVFAIGVVIIVVLTAIDLINHVAKVVMRIDD